MATLDPAATWDCVVKVMAPPGPLETAGDIDDVHVMIVWGLRHAEDPAVAEILTHAARELARLELAGHVGAPIPNTPHGLCPHGKAATGPAFTPMCDECLADAVPETDCETCMLAARLRGLGERAHCRTHEHLDGDPV